MLDVRGVSKSFATLRAVENVSFEVRSGEIYGLLGPNGAGKTTTISMISGLLRPDAGRISVGGADGGADRRHWRLSWSMSSSGGLTRSGERGDDRSGRGAASGGLPPSLTA